jgi:hypothetical protein
MTLFLQFCDYLPFEVDLANYLNKLEFNSSKDDLYQVWLKFFREEDFFSNIRTLKNDFSYLTPVDHDFY